MVFSKYGLAAAEVILAIASVSFYASAEPPGGQQAPASISDVKSNRPVPKSFKPNSFVSSLGKNRRDFTATHPADIPAELEHANLPANSGKIYALPELAKSNLLAPSMFQPPDYHYSIARGLSKSRIRNAKHPDYTGPQ